QALQWLDREGSDLKYTQTVHIGWPDYRDQLLPELLVLQSVQILCFPYVSPFVFIRGKTTVIALITYFLWFGILASSCGMSGYLVCSSLGPNLADEACFSVVWMSEKQASSA